MDAKTLEMNLNQLDTWKRLSGGGLFGGKSKKSLAAWQSADQKGVAPLYKLREDEHEGFHYAIFAFSTSGEISGAELAKLESTARDIDLGAIRYESKTNSSLECLRSFQADLDKDDGQHDQISIALTDEKSGRFVFVQAESSKSKLDAPLVAWALTGRKMLALPLAKAKLK